MRLDHLGLEVLAMPVEMKKERVDGVEIGAEARVEMPQILATDLVVELVEDVVEKGMRNLFVH